MMREFVYVHDKGFAYYQQDYGESQKDFMQGSRISFIFQKYQKSSLIGAFPFNFNYTVRFW